MNRPAFLFFAFLLSLVSGCSLPVTDGKDNPAEIQFRDRRDILEARIPPGAATHSYEGKDYDFYIFEWSEADQVVVRFEIRILSSGFHALTDPDYEAHFQKECNCAIAQKGWALVAGQKAREFQFSVDDRVSVERQFQWKDHMIEMQVLGLAARQEAMKQKFQSIQQSLHLL